MASVLTKLHSALAALKRWCRRARHWRYRWLTALLRPHRHCCMRVAGRIVRKGDVSSAHFNTLLDQAYIASERLGCPASGLHRRFALLYYVEKACR